MRLLPGWGALNDPAATADTQTQVVEFCTQEGTFRHTRASPRLRYAKTTFDTSPASLSVWRFACQTLSTLFGQVPQARTNFSRQLWWSFQGGLATTGKRSSLSI